MNGGKDLAKQAALAAMYGNALNDLLTSFLQAAGPAPVAETRPQPSSAEALAGMWDAYEEVLARITRIHEEASDTGRSPVDLQTWAAASRQEIATVAVIGLCLNGSQVQSDDDRQVVEELRAALPDMWLAAAFHSQLLAQHAIAEGGAA